jgi:hypothetical protein
MSADNDQDENHLSVTSYLLEYTETNEIFWEVS